MRGVVTCAAPHQGRSIASIPEGGLDVALSTDRQDALGMGDLAALLPQPHAFEGLALAGVDPPTDAFPVPELAHVPDHRVDGRVALRAAAAHAQGSDGQVTSVAQIENLGAEVGKGAEQARPPASDAVVAVIVAFHSGQDRDGLHVIVQHCQQGIEVAIVERLKRATGQVNVLLRQSPTRAVPRLRGLRPPFGS